MKLTTTKKILLALFLSVCMVIAVVVGVICYYLSCLFDPVPYPPVTVTMEEEAERQAMVGIKATQLAQSLGFPKKGETKTLVFNEKEVNGLIKAGVTVDDWKREINNFLVKQKLAQHLSVSTINLTFHDGVFEFQLSLLTSIPTPFGSYINVTGHVVPEITENAEKIHIKSLSIGSFRKSRQDLDEYERALSQTMQAQQNNPDYKDMRDAVSTLKVKGKDLEFIFYPYEFQQLLIKRGIDPQQLQMIGSTMEMLHEDKKTQ